MPLPAKTKKKAYLYPDGPGFNCPGCGLHISGSDSRVWFPPELNHAVHCEEDGIEICAMEEIEIVKK